MFVDTRIALAHLFSVTDAQVASDFLSVWLQEVAECRDLQVTVSLFAPLMPRCHLMIPLQVDNLGRVIFTRGQQKALHGALTLSCCAFIWSAAKCAAADASEQHIGLYGASLFDMAAAAAAMLQQHPSVLRSLSHLFFEAAQDVMGMTSLTSEYDRLEHYMPWLRAAVFNPAQGKLQEMVVDWTSAGRKASDTPNPPRDRLASQDFGGGGKRGAEEGKDQPPSATEAEAETLERSSVEALCVQAHGIFMRCCMCLDLIRASAPMGWEPTEAVGPETSRDSDVQDLYQQMETSSFLDGFPQLFGSPRSKDGGGGPRGTAGTTLTPKEYSFIQQAPEARFGCHLLPFNPAEVIKSNAGAFSAILSVVSLEDFEGVAIARHAFTFFHSLIRSAAAPLGEDTQPLEMLEWCVSVAAVAGRIITGEDVSHLLSVSKSFILFTTYLHGH